MARKARGASESKSKPKRKAKPKTQQEAQEQASVNGVLVQLVDNGQGGQQMQLQALGEVKVTELPTLLGLAKKQAESEFGI